MEDLFFENEDVIKVFKEVENYIIKDLNNNDDLEKLKRNHLFLAIYDITHTFYLNYIDINNCVTISSARTLSRKLYELLLYLKYILETDKESNKRAERYFFYNEHEKVKVVVSNAKDGGLSQQEIDNLKSKLTNLEQVFIDSFKNSKIKVNDIKGITRWYMEKSKGSKQIGTIQQLSEYFKMEYYYQHIYRNLSKDVHSRGHDMKETLNILGYNAQIQNYNQKADNEDKSLTSEIELSAFTNFIVFKYIEICCEFINNKVIYISYEAPFREYHNKKWEN